MTKRLIEAIMLTMVVSVCQATSYTWTPNVSGSWSDETKWTPTGTPAAGDTVSFGGTYNTDTTVTVGNTATVVFQQSTAISGGGALVFRGASSDARTLNVNNTASDIQITGGPMEFSGLDANISVSSSNKRLFLMGGGSAGPTRLILSGDSTMKLVGTMLLMSADNQTLGSRFEINDEAALVMSGSGAEIQPGRGQNTWGGIVQRGGFATSEGMVTFGNNANSFGTWEMFAGTNMVSADVRLALAGGSKAGLFVHGGKFTFGGETHLGRATMGRSEVFIDGGEVSFDDEKLFLVKRASDTADYPSVLTIAGDAYVHGHSIFPYGDTGTYNGQSRAMLNLNDDGLLSLSDSFYLSVSAATPRATLSFNGGTLERITGWPDSPANTNLLKGVDVVVYPGGGKLKARQSDGSASGMNLKSAKFRKAGGWGVKSITVTSGGAGYLLPPLVDITGGSGSNATAVAQIDYEAHQVTNVVVTCPGEGYSAGDTLTVSFVVPSKPSIVAATATAVLAENTSGVLTVLGGSTITLGSTFRYDGDFAMEAGAYAPITGDVTLGGTSAFRDLVVKDNGTLTIAGLATATWAEMQGLGRLVVTDGGSVTVNGTTSLRGTIVVARAGEVPLVTVVGNCSFTPVTGYSRVATIIPADDLHSSTPIPVLSITGSVTDAPVLDDSGAERWRLRTKVENSVTKIYLVPKRSFVISVL